MATIITVAIWPPTSNGHELAIEEEVKAKGCQPSRDRPNSFEAYSIATFRSMSVATTSLLEGGTCSIQPASEPSVPSAWHAALLLP